jgi:tRNA pseudouridine13 synthase
VIEYVLSDWQRTFGKRIHACHIRTENADLQIREQLGFSLSGDGEHDYLQVEKDGVNTAWVICRLAKYAGVVVSDVGYAGLKDRYAVATQWFSVRRSAGTKAD